MILGVYFKCIVIALYCRTVLSRKQIYQCNGNRFASVTSWLQNCDSQTCSVHFLCSALVSIHHHCYGHHQYPYQGISSSNCALPKYRSSLQAWACQSPVSIFERTHKHFVLCISVGTFVPLQLLFFWMAHCSQDLLDFIRQVRENNMDNCNSRVERSKGVDGSENEGGSNNVNGSRCNQLYDREETMSSSAVSSSIYRHHARRSL